MKDKYLAATDHFASGPRAMEKNLSARSSRLPSLSVESEWRVLVCLAARGKADQTTHRIKPFTCGAESFRTWSMVLMVTFVMGATWKTVQLYWWRLRDPNRFFWSPCLAKILFYQGWHGLFAARRSTARLSSDASRWFLPKTAGSAWPLAMVRVSIFWCLQTFLHPWQTPGVLEIPPW